MRLRGAVSIVVVATALDCSSSSTDSNSGGGGTQQSFADEYCSTLRPCCGGPDADGRQPGSGCQDFQSLAVLLGGKYDPAAGSACLSDLQAHKTDADFCKHVSQVAPSCKNVYVATHGTTKPGDECTRDADCAESTAGDVTCEPNGSNGTPKFICQLQKVGKAGDAPCIGTKADGFAVGAGSGPAPAEGFVCDTANGLYCADSGACEAQKAIGEACRFGSSYECKEGSTCEFSGKCEAKPASVDAGAPSSSTDPLLFGACAYKGS